MFPLRASSNDSVLVDVDYIKLANAKMIERNYLIKINLTKDTIIRNKDVLLDVYKDNLLYKEKVINNLKDSNKKYKNRFNIMKYSTIGIISILSIVLMIK